MVKFTKKDAEEALKKGADSISKADLKKVLEKRKEIEEKFKGSKALSRFVEDIKLLFSIVKDYISGDYKKVPWWSVAAIVFTLLYVVSPMDIIPDFIPLIGSLDDVLIVGVCLAVIDSDLHKYKEWKEKNKA